MYDATYGAHMGSIPNLPVLFIMLCISGGGRIVQKTDLQDFDAIIEPGGIGVTAPFSTGFGEWPELRAIGMGIEVGKVMESFGDRWPERLHCDVISNPFCDALVETTMMQIGYTQAGKTSDEVLKYAAQMVIHKLLDNPFELEIGEQEPDGIIALDLRTIDLIGTFINENIGQQITVLELSKLCGVSQYHFSRRFKAATGISPYQYVLQKKLDFGASALSGDSGKSIIDVAQSVGFDNPAQFAKAFRRRFGLAPRNWRAARN
ncbi:MAG: AraC family transcriptional regulator [Pseudomonadota bacterium]